MNLFTCLPEALLMSIFIDWLCLRDFCRLDSAFCHKKSRLELHNLVSANRYTLSVTWFDSTTDNVEWMILRGIRFSHVELWGRLSKNSVLYEQFIVHLGYVISELFRTFCVPSAHIWSIFT